MTWEEYQNTDFYKESHVSDDYRTAKEKFQDEKTDLVLSCAEDINMYRNENNGDYIETKDGEVYDKDTVEILDDGTVLNVTYVCATTWNGRVNGIICSGDYEKCRLAKMEYDIQHIKCEWQWAVINRITYSNEDELEEILIGYRECDDYWWDEDY